MYLITLIVFISVIFQIQSFSILGIFPSSDFNNFGVYRRVFKELAGRGHEITLLSHFELNVPGITHLPLSKNPERLMQSYETVIDNELVRVPHEIFLECQFGHYECKALLNNGHVRQMIRDKSIFDVVIVESYNSDCGLALAANLSAPYIAFSPDALRPWQYSRLGITFNSANVPLGSLPYGRQPWFLERLKSYILYHVSNCLFYIASQVTDHVFLYDYLGEQLPSMESLAANASLVLVNSHPSVFGGVPRADNVIDVGGIHVSPPKALPTEMQNFVNEAENGVIYVNLGSDMVEDTLPKEYLQALVKTFSTLPLRVLWKWNGNNIEKLPKNVMIMRWFPQYDVLSHENVKVFVTRADISSAIESVQSGTPAVAIPLFGNEYGNAASLRDSGVATLLPYQNIQESFLHTAINEALDPQMQNQAKELAKIWKDRPSSPINTAIYWVEFVARNKADVNMIAPSVTPPLIVRHQLDILAFLALVVCVLSFAFYKILSICCCCSCGSREEANETLFRETRREKRVKFE